MVTHLSSMDSWKYVPIFAVAYFYPCTAPIARRLQRFSELCELRYRITNVHVRSTRDMVNSSSRRKSRP